MHVGAKQRWTTVVIVACTYLSLAHYCFNRRICVFALLQQLQLAEPVAHCSAHVILVVTIGGLQARGLTVLAQGRAYLRPPSQKHNRVGW